MGQWLASLKSSNNSFLSLFSNDLLRFLGPYMCSALAITTLGSARYLLADAIMLPDEIVALLPDGSSAGSAHKKIIPAQEDPILHMFHSLREPLDHLWLTRRGIIHLLGFYSWGELVISIREEYTYKRERFLQIQLGDDVRVTVLEKNVTFFRALGDFVLRARPPVRQSAVGRLAWS